MLAGIAVLLGAIASARAARMYDNVILRVLGASRGQLLFLQLAEYGLLALVLAGVALGLGSAIAWGVVVQLFEFDWLPDWPRILAVLEPRSNTMKLGTMKAQLPGSLAQADQVFCYAKNLGWDAAEALAPMGAKADVFDDLDAMVAAIVAVARPGDHVLVMSNGGFGGIHGKLLAALAA